MYDDVLTPYPICPLLLPCLLSRLPIPFFCLLAFCASFAFLRCVAFVSFSLWMVKRRCEGLNINNDSQEKKGEGGQDEGDIACAMHQD